MTKFSSALTIVALAVSSVDAFVASPVVHSTTQARPAFAPLHLMADTEADMLIASANECVESECAVDDINSFVVDLKEQSKLLSERLDKMNNIIASLEGGNVAPDRDVPYLKSLIEDLAVAVFDTKGSHDPDGPSTPPMGYPGEVFKGDAYTSLNPKPWTAPTP
uniref:Uncharacterized protein n=1 Tax=Corethron hystrix TaxID=216773 RepID=A0A7S1FQ79_9STRA|mmetsp:Transcript_20206/g.45792  ORF Transcript_20206/g.45792 Transcript_20206/m.45792 type:complete len:164 (+) Transcript_20206:168-659(+)